MINWEIGEDSAANRLIEKDHTFNAQLLSQLS